MTVSPSPIPAAVERLVKALERTRDKLADFVRDHEDPGADAMACLWEANEAITAARIAALSLPAIAAGASREELAKVIWEAFSPECPFDRQPDKSVRRALAAADAVLSLTAAPGWNELPVTQTAGFFLGLDDYGPQVWSAEQYHLSPAPGCSPALPIDEARAVKLWQSIALPISPAKPTTSEELPAPGEPG